MNYDKKNKKKEVKKVIEEFDKAYKNDDFNLCMRKANILEYLNYLINHLTHLLI